MKQKIFLFSLFQLGLYTSTFCVEVEEKASKSFFEVTRVPVLIGLLILCGLIWYYIQVAKKGQHIFIRKIAGLNAIDDALGRATEMGKPVLYVPGIMEISDLQTLASISILGHIAKKTASFETDLFVPNRDPLVFSTAQEVVKESYLAAGRPDAYNENMVEYLTTDQFGYVAGVNGYMVREEPAANFYLGGFYAESLLLAETGNAVGAIQVAGTAIPSQIPFFISACDYTLIGEELYAAGAYLSDDPRSKGSLKGQDMGKLAIMVVTIFLVLFNVAYNMNISSGNDSSTGLLGKVFTVLESGMKGE
jgi:hypothetical protein